MKTIVKGCGEYMRYFSQYGDDNNKIIIDDIDYNFKITGSKKIVALHILNYALRYYSKPILNSLSALSIGPFYFEFYNGVNIKPLRRDPSQEVLDFIEELKAVLKLKAFL